MMDYKEIEKEKVNELIKSGKYILWDQEEEERRKKSYKKEKVNTNMTEKQIEEQIVKELKKTLAD
jgi:ATP-dependent exoDNAse (exonuclease V) alpha subunit